MKKQTFDSRTDFVNWLNEQEIKDKGDWYESLPYDIWANHFEEQIFQVASELNPSNYKKYYHLEESFFYSQRLWFDWCSLYR